MDSPHTLVTAADRQFVLDNINRQLRLERPITAHDVIAERCGVRPLAVSQDSDTPSDFLEMSRKHAIDVDARRKHLSIFGGKLTDCINVGDEVCETVGELGVPIGRPVENWYGEPRTSVRDGYFRQAREMNLDAYTGAHCSEVLSARFWRRYGRGASGLLDTIRADPRQAEILIKGTEYTRCEIDYARRQEMIVKLDDFLRRRSKISLMMTGDDIRAADGFMEACEVLFPGAAKARFDEYFRPSP